MGKVIDITKLPLDYDLLTQTPPNYSERNYWLNQNQEKVDADWVYRPNRAWVEQEMEFGTANYRPLEVVVQTVKNDTTQTIISDDWRRLVFRDTFYQCPLGLKFKFSYNFNLREPEENKSVWLATNRNTASPTGSIVIVRCNGTLGSVYTDSQGFAHNHYEPVIQTKDLGTAGLFYNATAVTQNADLICIVQHNNFTRNYYVNQRFIVGYDKVYRINAISKFASNRTFVPDDLGTIVLYMEIVEASAKDDFATRIAYNQKAETKIIETEGSTADYRIKFLSPLEFPTNLTDAIEFKPVLFADEEQVPIQIQTTWQLMNSAAPAEPISEELRDKYVEMIPGNDNSFILSRKQFYPGGPLLVSCFIPAEDSPSGKEISATFNLSLRGL